MASDAGIDGPQQPSGCTQPQHSCKDFTIGVICALAVEKAAFVAMLDQVYETLPTPKDDSNSYTFGRIGNHNLVAACLPVGMMGNNSSAIVAKDMSRSFSIKLGLMVGVGGGVWSPTVDIRLGDVVVSQPDGIHGGVVQWDFGKMESGGFKRTGSLNKPPRPLLNAVQDIKTKHLTEGNQMSQHLSNMVQNNPRMAQAFLHQGREQDCLYEPSYAHVGGETCAGCDVRRRVQRPQRITTNPHVHYGNIASGNGVIKNGEFRDRIAQEEGVICFEMEAAGLMDNFPCLVIRGICDYADSHKNKRWQPYAAATAAAYAKDLLGGLKLPGVNELEPAMGAWRFSPIFAREEFALSPSSVVLAFYYKFTLTFYPEASPYLAPFNLEGVPRVRKFVNRPTEMLGIEQALLQPGEHGQRQKIYVLRGLGGIGKTQLAVEFARRHHRRFSAVLWLDGRSEDTIKRSIAGCASRIPRGQIPERSMGYATEDSAGVEGVVRDVLAWLARADNTAWLLIIDNVDREYNQQCKDQDAYDVRRYLSGADHGCVLITTRLARLEQLGDSHHLGKVGEDQAKAIFESWYKKPYDAVLGRSLLKLLDGLPLAIAQAGAYLQESGVGLEAYLLTYEQQWEELMNSSAPDDALLQDYPDRSMWTTWTISYQAVRIKNQSAANLLLLWSFLDNKDLWHGLFTSACQNSEDATEILSKWIGDVARNTVAFGRAMQLLCNYSLVEAATETMSYATHPVVHRWAYHYQGKQLAGELGQLAIIVVGWAAPQMTDGNFIALRRRLLPHAKACSVGVEREKPWPINKSGDLSGLDIQHNRQQRTFLDAMFTLGGLHAHFDMLSEAEYIFLQALRGYKETVGPEHELTLIAGRVLGSLYRKQGKLVEAENVFIQVLQKFEAALGSDHPSTLNTLYELGVLYRDQGKLVAAQHTLERALQVFDAALESDDIVTEEFFEIMAVNVVNSLGSVHRSQGNLAEAEQLILRALRTSETVLGSSHPSTLVVLGNLGILYVDLGNLVEAKHLFEQLLTKCEAALGSDHIKTSTTAVNLGNVYLDQGRLEEAEHMFERSVRRFEAALGSDNMSTLDAVLNLGSIYLEQGRLSEAEAMLERAHQGYKKVLGDESALRSLPALITIVNLGTLYERQGRVVDAKAKYSSALSGLQSTIGPISARWIALATHTQKMHAELDCDKDEEPPAQ